MSFDIHWEYISGQDSLKTTANFLNEAIQKELARFPLISDFHLELVDVGNNPPTIDLLDISDPQFPFQSAAGEGHATNEKDVQMTLRVAFDSPVEVIISFSLTLNYPSSKFVSLPIRLTLRRINLMAKVIFVRTALQTIMISLVRDADTRLEYDFEAEIGDPNRHVLKKVGKVEGFIQSIVSKLLNTFVIYPSFITIPESLNKS